jgi:hypothetical protein
LVWRFELVGHVFELFTYLDLLDAHVDFDFLSLLLHLSQHLDILEFKDEAVGVVELNARLPLHGIDVQLFLVFLNAEDDSHLGHVEREVHTGAFLICSAADFLLRLTIILDVLQELCPVIPFLGVTPEPGLLRSVRRDLIIVVGLRHLLEVLLSLTRLLTQKMHGL